MTFTVMETVKLKSNGELVDIQMVKDQTLVVCLTNYKTTGIAEDIEVPFDAVEKVDLPPVSTYNDFGG